MTLIGLRIESGHPLAAFALEEEPAIRACLFCQKRAPLDMRTASMTYEASLGALHTWHSLKRHVGWYSNAILLPDGTIVRFYLCPEHLERLDEAWQWARTGDYKGV